jgi:hypothetical protein
MAFGPSSSLLSLCGIKISYQYKIWRFMSFWVIESVLYMWMQEEEKEEVRFLDLFYKG